MTHVMQKEGEDFVKKMLESIRNPEQTKAQDQLGAIDNESVQDAMKQLMRGNTPRKSR